MEDLIKILFDEKHSNATFTLLWVAISWIITFAITIYQAKLHAKNLQKEREYNFNKEKYDNLLQVSESISKIINLNDEIILKIIHNINNTSWGKLFFLKNKNLVDINNLHFPKMEVNFYLHSIEGAIEKFNQLEDKVDIIRDIYFAKIYWLNFYLISYEDIEKINEEFNNYNKIKKEFYQIINLELIKLENKIKEQLFFNK